MQQQTFLDSLWCVGHGKADEVTTGQREEDHDGSEPSIVVEQNRKPGARLDITEHQQRDEHHPGDDQCWEQTGLFTRLGSGKTNEITLNPNRPNYTHENKQTARTTGNVVLYPVGGWIKTGQKVKHAIACGPQEVLMDGKL